MSQTFSVSRSSTSSEDGDHDYRRQYFSSQTSDGSSIPPIVAAAPAPEVSVGSSSSVTSPEQRPLRLLDVSNILNPTPQGSIDSSRRPSLAHYGSPRSSVHGAARHGALRSLSQSPVVLSNPVDPTLRTGGGGGIGSSDGGSGTFPGRRIAPAVPPSSRVRQTTRPSLSGIIGVQDNNPFPLSTARRGTGYGSEMHANPGRPPPPAHPPVAGPSSQASFPFPPPPVPTTPLQSYAASFSTPMPSANASPNTSYSSYVQTQSPVPTTPTFNHPGYISGHLNVVGGGSGGGGGPQGSSYSISGPSSHGGYQMMALNTSEGAIHIPVNTTAASRSADEKRKRNAGASARFRQRRKEREREMSTRISDLEQRLKKVEDERDYYRDLALRSQQQQQQQQQQRPGRPPQQHPPSLASPRGIGPGEGSGGGGGGAFGGFGSRSGELPRPGSTTSASMRELPGIEGGGFPGRSAQHPGMPAGRSGGDMRESSSSSAAAIRRNSERERERYEREREREQRHPSGDERRHH